MTSTGSRSAAGASRTSRRSSRQLPTRAEREPVLRAGEGGDDTTAIDAAAEDAVVARLEALDADFTLVSEELGERAFGAGGPLRVVVDPIDGSVNAKRGIPFFSLSLAVANGPTMDDVTFGFVYDFGAREEWVAEQRRRRAPRRRAARRARRRRTRSRSSRSRRRRPPPSRSGLPACSGVAQRLRVMGSLALSLCHLAAGRVDAVCWLKPARSIDIAAAQLLVRERGYAIELFEDPPFARGAARSRRALAGRRRRDAALCDASRPRCRAVAGRRSRGQRRTRGRLDGDGPRPRCDPQGARAVIDPELKPVTELDMVRDVAVRPDGSVEVRSR